MSSISTLFKRLLYFKFLTTFFISFSAFGAGITSFEVQSINPHGPMSEIIYIHYDDSDSSVSFELCFLEMNTFGKVEERCSYIGKREGYSMQKLKDQQDYLDKKVSSLSYPKCEFHTLWILQRTMPVKHKLEIVNHVVKQNQKILKLINGDDTFLSDCELNKTLTFMRFKSYLNQILKKLN
jgi:hypothetical protein